jgi:hypothetical protein
LWHGDGLCCQAGFSLGSVPSAPVPILASLLCLVASLCNNSSATTEASPWVAMMQMYLATVRHHVSAVTVSGTLPADFDAKQCADHFR